MKKILYIDDNKHNLSLLKTVLRSKNYESELICVENPEEFLKKSILVDIDLFLIDFTLENILGDELYSRLLQTVPEPKVIIISAGMTKDLASKFINFEHQPVAITDRFGAMEIIDKELELQ